MRVLIVDNRINLAQCVKKALEAEGFAADFMKDEESALKRIFMYYGDYDLVVLAFDIEKKSGVSICQEIRERNINLPIMMVGENKEENIIASLDAGADSYLTQPFSFDVLLAKIRAILRRPPVTVPCELMVQNIRLNVSERKCFIDEAEARLTLKEFSLLELLMINSGQVLTREQIISKVWDFSFDSFANVVDVHITNIRKKIGDKEGKIIETVRGIGYRMAADRA